MKNSSTVSSKGQVTIPIEVRRRLGIEAGDAVEFCLDNGEAVLRPRKRRAASFKDFIGILGQWKPGDPTAVEWVRSLRDDSERRK